VTASFSTTAGQDRALAVDHRARRRRWLVLGTVVFAAIAAVAWAGLGASRQWGTPRVDAQRLTVAEVTVAALVRQVNAEGKVVAGGSFTLVAPAAGTVIWRVQAGDAVKAAQLLGTLSSPELEARLAQSRAASSSSQADWLRVQAEAASQRGAAQATVASAELELQAAVLLEKRQRTALDAGATSALQFEAARDQAARARIQLDQAKSALALKSEALKHEVDMRQAAFQRARSEAEELARQQALLSIRAPQDGAIGQRLVGDGASVARDAALLTVVDLRRLDVQLQVPESLVRELALQQAGEIMVNGRPVAATVVAISPEVVNGEVATRLRFAGDQPSDLRQNQRLAARVLLERRDAVLGVQRGPFVEQYGARMAWVLGADGVARKQAVVLGAQSLDRVEVKSGLRAGDRVVVGGLESQPTEVHEVLVRK
jgi:HlyD family secretion protein